MKVKNSKAARQMLEVLKFGGDTARTPKGIREEANQLRKTSLSWLADESVQGIAVACKIIDEEETDVAAVTVYVDKKVPLNKARNPAPKRLHLGKREVEVDVQEIGILKPHSYMKRKRPVHPGLGLANAQRESGTLGFLLRSKTVANEAYILSNHHVLAYLPPSRERWILQPGKDFGGGINDRVGKYFRSLPLRASASKFDNIADAAIAKITPSTNFRILLPLIGNIKGTKDKFRKGQLIRMIGAKSGFSSGEIRNSKFDMALKYKFPSGVWKRVGFHSQVLCTRYARPGDSGALIVNSSKYAIGMHVGGSSKASVFCPLSPILSQFECEPILNGEELERILDS